MADQNRQSPDEEVQDPNVLQKMGGHLKTRTVNGLLKLLPLIVTIIVIVILTGYVDSAVFPVLEFIAGIIPGIDSLPTFRGLGLIIACVLFYAIGLIVATPVGRKGMDWLTNLVRLIPVVKGIYNVTLQATAAVTSEFAFSRVVFVEWPREGMVAMGFVTAEIRAESRPMNPTFALVYIPTVPNPTSGNMALVPQDDLLETDLSVDDAMKLVFSGGIVPPDAFNLARLPEDFREKADYEGGYTNTATLEFEEGEEQKDS